MTNESMEKGSDPERVSDVFREVVRSRSIVLLTVIVDSLLLAVLVYIFVLVHYTIGDMNRFWLIDKIVIIALQVVGGISTIGLMLSYLVRDLIVAAQRLWRDR
jgi:hypothetical protein